MPDSITIVQVECLAALLLRGNNVQIEVRHVGDYVVVSCRDQMAVCQPDRWRQVLLSASRRVPLPS